jgi:spermidine/putrescine transport system permease protein
MKSKQRSALQEWILTVPSFGWLIAFVAIPSLIVLAIAFRPATPYGGIGAGWTLDTIRNLVNPAYAAIAWRTFWLSALTTLACVLLATPTAYYIARSPVVRRRWLLLAVVVPFWTSFLIRIFAWKVLLHPDGLAKRLLVGLHVISNETLLLYSSGAVLLVMVYTFLPFAILPIYAAAEKFDFRLTEAARDLGATRLKALVSVFLPGIRRGMLTAILVVFIPALGSYIIPDLVGGASAEMIGNKIAQRTFVDRNLPHASALSACLMLAVLSPLIAILLSQGRVTGFLRGSNQDQQGVSDHET